MRIKIGKLHILFTWGDPLDELRRKHDEVVKSEERIRKLREAVARKIEEENEPEYIKEVKGWIRKGNMLEAVKTYLKANPDDGLRNARIAVENIKSKMEIDAKNK